MSLLARGTNKYNVHLRLILNHLNPRTAKSSLQATRHSSQAPQHVEDTELAKNLRAGVRHLRRCVQIDPHSGGISDAYVVKAARRVFLHGA